MPNDYKSRHFSEWTLDDATQAIQAAIIESVGEDAFARNRLYVERGDHWQKGATFPIRHSNPDVNAQILAAVEPMFCPVDLVEEATARQVNALLDKMPAIVISPRVPAGADGAPSVEQAARAARMREHLSAWWDHVQFWERARAAATRVAWATRGPLRWRYLPAAIVERRRITADGEEASLQLRDDLPFADALGLVFFSAPSPDVALLYTHPDTQERAAIITATDETGKQYAEIWYMDGRTAIRRTVRSGGASEVFPIPGGRLPLAEMTGTLLLTESVRRQQARADFFETLLSRTAETAGFRDRYIGNAEPNYVWSRTPPEDGPAVVQHTDDGGTTWYGHPMPRILGAGMVQELQGRPVPVGDGTREGLTTPSVTIADPVDPDYVVKACRHARLTLLENCHQAHVLEADKATSGYSKKQGRADFEKHVRGYVASAELAIMSALEGAIAAALLLTRDGDEWAKFLEEYRITVTLSVDTGPLSAEEVEVEMRAAERLFKPRKDVQALIGVSDAETADAAIMSDPIQGLDVQKKRGEVFAAWSAANLEAGILASGADEDLARAARRQDYAEEQ